MPLPASERRQTQGTGKLKAERDIYGVKVGRSPSLLVKQFTLILVSEEQRLLPRD